MQEIRARETVILAGDYEALVAWYRDVLGFAATRRFDGDYNYCNLASGGGVRIGIAPAAEMQVEPGDRARNTVILQIEVDDVRALFEQLTSGGGVITSGPSYDKNDGFWFGSFADPEGNPVWVVDKNCP